MSDTTKVEFAAAYTDRAGKDHKADSSAALPADEARELVHLGAARLPSQSTAGYEDLTVAKLKAKIADRNEHRGEAPEINAASDKKPDLIAALEADDAAAAAS